MAQTLSWAEADFEIVGAYEATQAILFLELTPSAGSGISVTYRRENDGTPANYAWRVETTGTDDWNITEGPGVARITLTDNGADTDWAVTVDGVEIATGSMTGTAGATWTASLRTSCEGASTVGQTRCYRFAAETPSAYSWSYPWNNAAELADWAEAIPGVVLGSGYLTDPNNVFRAYWIYKGLVVTETVLEVSACIAPPGILRRAKTYGPVTGDLATEYVAGGYVDVLTSNSDDRHPEIRFIDAPGAALAMAWQRDADIVLATGNGSPLAGGWGTVQTVRASRAKPTMCVLAPSHDLYLIHLGGNSNDIAYGQTLAWNGSSYDIGSEVTVATDADDERGEIVQEPGGVLVYAYRTGADAVAILSSPDRGDTWA